jgi:hypothetical protein
MSDLQAFNPDSLCSDPMRTLSGANRSEMAVPSARNSVVGVSLHRTIQLHHLPGLERMSKVHPGFELASRMVRMALDPVSKVTSGRCNTHSAVLHGTVDFSTTILEEVETSAIRRVAS